MAVLVLVVGGLLGLVTWIPLHAGQPVPRAMIETPAYVFTLALPLGLALWIARHDPWLGAFVGYATVRALLPPSALGLQMALWIATGAAGVVLLQQAEPRVVRAATWALVGLGLLQVGMVVAQSLGVDPLYPGATRVHGTLESPKILAGALAVIAALAPWPAALILAAAILGLQAFLAAAALGVGLLVRYRAAWRWAVPVAGLLVLAAVLKRGDGLGDSTGQRLSVWAMALRDLDHSWAGMLFGHGFGAWHQRIPALQLAVTPDSGDVYFWSYSEPLQLWYEGGLVALLCLGGWLYQHRAMWRGPFAGAAAALGVVACGQFPFHLATTGGLGVLALGLASRSLQPGADRLAATLGVGQGKQAV